MKNYLKLGSMMKLDNILLHLKQNSQNLNEEFKRLFHGRGGLYEGWGFLTIDSIDTILSVAFYFEVTQELEYELIEMFKNYMKDSRHTSLVLQKRYIKGSPSEVLVGEIAQSIFVVENNMKIKLNLLSNKNNGYFPDMKNGREFVKQVAKNKSVLNLFSYTCAFSISAKLGGASKVSNIDMSKSALSTGRENHQLNDIDTRGVAFLPYNILKSFSRIKKQGPYDLIIIDPPTFQRGSFEATKDYQKIISKLPMIASTNCTLLACLNSPNLDAQFLKNLVKELAPSFKFIKQLENVKEFASLDESRSLKNLVFRRENELSSF